ncbi:vacuolar membrane-associated protein iml1 [Ceratobasidium sp. 428]|nr:vacuolar membrane-associated protein iml1 [Ceratobasidium sp. 428]
MLDQGFGLDLICLAKRPLHTSPIFSFQGIEPTPVPASEGISRAMDPLWGGGRNESDHPPKDLKTFWWEPFWVCASFWDKQRDMPFRQDRFVTRARMYEVQMLGLLEHDVTATISIPQMDSSHINPLDNSNSVEARRLAREEFDRNVFASVADKRHGHHDAHHHHHNTTPQTRSSEASAPSTASATDMESSQSSLNELLEETPKPNQPQIPMPTLPFKNLRKPNLRRASTSRARLEVVPSFKGHSPEPLPALSLPTVDSTPSTPIRSYVHSAQPQRRSVSPSQESIRSTSTVSSRRKTGPGSLTSLAKNWLFTPFRPAAPVPTASAVHIERLAEDVAAGPSTILPPAPTPRSTPVPPDPIAIAKRRSEPKRVSRPAPEDSASPSDDPALAALRRTSTVPVVAPVPQIELTNPSRPAAALPENQITLARRWQHLFPRPSFAHQIKWRSICTPACLPLSVSYIPPQREVNTTWRDYDYIVMLNSEDVRTSFLLGADENMDQNEQALLVMRGMASLRLTQGFQFVVSSDKQASSTIIQGQNSKQNKSSGKQFLIGAGSALNRSHPVGISEVLKSAKDVVCLSMSDQIQQISYDPSGGEVLVRRWIRRSSHPTDPFRYECLVWPKLGTGYTEVSTTFSFPVLEEYGWNRTDTLVAGYERDLSDALRYWRTRYLVIPSEDAPLTPLHAPRGDSLDEEEIRLLGVTERLAELFARARWLRPDEHDLAPPRFVETTLDPAYCVQDEGLMAQIEEVHARGPLKKKRQSERALEDMSPGAVARAMREEGGVPIKDNKWHGIEYPDSFTGRDFVAWLVREFKDVSTREQGVEQGNRLLGLGLFEHCRGAHGLLDG